MGKTIGECPGTQILGIFRKYLLTAEMNLSLGETLCNELKLELGPCWWRERRREKLNHRRAISMLR